MGDVIQFYREGEHTLPVPQPAGYGDFGYDVATPVDVTLEPGIPQLVGVGFSLASPLPTGVAMFVLPRSSTRRKFSSFIPNSPGLVDRYYGDELKVQLENLTDQPVTIQAGERFAQLVFVPLLMPAVAEVTSKNPNMTRSGFGSTGT